MFVVLQVVFLCGPNTALVFMNTQNILFVTGAECRGEGTGYIHVLLSQTEKIFMQYSVLRSLFMPNWNLDKRLR